MKVAEHIARLAEDGPRLAAAAGRAGWDRAVPGTRWTVRELVLHTGGIHRWAADIVASRASGLGTEAGKAVGSGPPDDELLAWFGDGHAALLHTLRAAPTDLKCATFLPATSPLAFWARRQAHETAVHRGDAEAATGERPRFDPAFAQDGIAELLLGFAARKSNAIALPGSIALVITDGPSWLITLGGELIVADKNDAAGDATVTGTSAELYLWLWNRSSTATVRGDTAIADAWRNVQVRWR